MAEKENKNAIDIFEEELNYLTDRTGSVEFGRIEKEKETGIFFKRKVLEVETYILRKGKYISLLGVCTYIQKYLKSLSNINNKIFEIIKKQEDICLSTYEVTFKDNILNISFVDVYDRSCYLSINSTKFPKVLTDSKFIYAKIKDEIYKYITFLYSYQNFLNATNEEISIGENTTFKIEPFGVRSQIITVSICFGDIALYEIQISDFGFKILSFSKDLEVNNFLAENKEEMFDQIFIEESKLKDFLSICVLTND